MLFSLEIFVFGFMDFIKIESLENLFRVLA
jgi:ribosomal protein S4E